MTVRFRPRAPSNAQKPCFTGLFYFHDTNRYKIAKIIIF